MWTREQAEGGEVDKVRDGLLMKEMNRQRRHSRQEMEREVKKGRYSVSVSSRSSEEKPHRRCRVCAMF